MSKIESTETAPVVESVVKVIGTDTVKVFRHFEVRCARGTVAKIDLGAMADDHARTVRFGLGERNRVNDRLGEKGITLGDAQKIVDACMAGWASNPAGRTRGESDPFLNEARRVVVQASIMKAADAKVATLEGLKTACGAKWDKVAAIVGKRIKEAEELAGLSID